MANALAQESSPYLRQHAGNPVDWLPWGPEALARARTLDRPLLVSIGYSACHWCHVMERECFEDEEIAALMNARFVCVKVDREERPDVDALYLDAVQAMTGQGGWPLHVFLTPDQRPFFGGTYFPPVPRQGMPGWPQVLVALGTAWETEREQIEQQGAAVAARLAGGAVLRPSADALSGDGIDAAIATLRRSFDSVDGGWGDAPKFPAASTIELLLARGETRMSVSTLLMMASGGIYDQVGGGFARYATDATWTVPHFEKMLYDNAGLARAYLHGFQATGDLTLRRVCEETLDWILRDLRGPEGGFMAALDADSEGVEGRFYVWTLAELRDALGADFEAAAWWFGASEEGNWPEEPGVNVLEDRGPRPAPEVVARIRATLLAVRSQRVWPGLDDKRLAAWNALAIGALADAGAVLGRADYLEAAERAAAFVLGVMRVDGRLMRTSDGRSARIDAYLEDHAFLLEALLTLYEATFEERWFTEALWCAEQLLTRFLDEEHGGFFSVACDAEPLVARRKDLEDHPVPAGGSSAALGLLRLAMLTGEHRYEAAARGQLQLLHALALEHPHAFGHLLRALDLLTRERREVAVVGPAPEALLAVVRGRLRPGVVLAGGGPRSAVPLLAGRSPVDGRAAAYVCEGFACRAPVTEPDALAALLAD